MRKAVFVICKVDDHFIAVTRPGDEKHNCSVGLPGGKVDPGETNIEALVREAREEGWAICGIDPIPVKQEELLGFDIYWYWAEKAEKLEEYKEKPRGIQPILLPAETILENSPGYGNEIILRFID